MWCCMWLLYFCTCFAHFGYRPRGILWTIPRHGATNCQWLGGPNPCSNCTKWGKDGEAESKPSAAGVVIEIGFNAGHSSLLMLAAHPKLQIVAFDLCEHSYTRHRAAHVALSFLYFLFSSWCSELCLWCHVAFSSSTSSLFLPTQDRNHMKSLEISNSSIFILMCLLVHYIFHYYFIIS